MDSDFTVSDQGSLVLLIPQSDVAMTWVRGHIPSDAMRTGPAIVIEHHYADAILEGIADDGLTVEAI